MLIVCDKCNAQADCKMDKETGDIICTECGGVVEKVTPFIRQAMKTSKDFLETGKQAFSFVCEACSKRQPCVVTRDGQKVVCSICKTEIQNVSPFFKSTMKNLGIYEQ